MAARDGQGNIVRLLLESGADISLRDHDGLTPLHHAVSREGNLNIVQLPKIDSPTLEVLGGEERSAPLKGSRFADAEIFKLLPENGADFEVQSKPELTAVDAPCSTPRLV